jgi:hypothetical protein
MFSGTGFGIVVGMAIMFFYDLLFPYLVKFIF